MKAFMSDREGRQDIDVPAVCTWQMSASDRALHEARAILAESEPPLDMHFGSLSLDGKRGSYHANGTDFRERLTEAIARALAEGAFDEAHS